MSNLTKRLLKHIHDSLENDNWGDIDPDYFDPDYFDPDDEDAAMIRQYVEDALRELGQIK